MGSIVRIAAARRLPPLRKPCLCCSRCESRLCSAAVPEGGPLPAHAPLLTLSPAVTVPVEPLGGFGGAAHIPLPGALYLESLESSCGGWAPLYTVDAYCRGLERERGGDITPFPATQG